MSNYFLVNDTFREWYFIIQNITVTFTLFFNFLLIFLIKTKSPKKLGSYKYFMIYFCCFAILFSILQFVCRLEVFSYQGGLILFTEAGTSEFENTLRFVGLNSACGGLGASMTIAAVHFAYRFYALERKGNLRFFQGKFLVFWFTLPLIFGGLWGFLCSFFRLTENSSELLNIQKALFIHDISIDSIICIVSSIYSDSSGNLILSYTKLHVLIALFLLETFLIIIIIIYGYLAYKKVNNILNDGISEYAKKMQKQLYRALLVQTIIPFIIVFLPMFVCLFLPFFNVDIGEAGRFATFLFMLHPAFDTIPVLFIVDQYRNALRS